MSRAKSGQLSPKALNTPSVAQSSVEIAAANPTRVGLILANPSPTVTLWICPGATAAAANGEGSLPVQPLQQLDFTGDMNITNSLNAVYESGTGVVTVWELYE